MEIKNFKKAGNRLLKALKNKEKIIIYSDSDLDGIGGAIILKETIEALGGKINSIYFPAREEGYGLTNKGLKFLKPRGPGLLICVDLGTTNYQEVKELKKFGLETIIIDHHDVLGKLPPAILINPKQKGDKYSFKLFASVGLVYKFSENILPLDKFKELKNGLLELAALGTIADFMPRIEENKKIVNQGTQFLKNSKRPGIRVFFKEKFIDNFKTEMEGIEGIVSVLNSGEQKGNLTETYLLLTAKNIAQAKKLFSALLKRKKKRKLDIENIIKEVEKKSFKNKKFIFDFHERWKVVHLGAAASKLVQKYKKPAFLLTNRNNVFVGSIRSPKEINILNSLKKCARLLKTYGGHPQAAGFRLKKENFKKFKDHLTKYFSNL